MVVFPSQDVKISFDLMEKVLNLAKWLEYHFSTHFILLFEALVVQIWLLSKKITWNAINLLNIVNDHKNLPNFNMMYHIL
jgi:hypothetical protein